VSRDSNLPPEPRGAESDEGSAAGLANSVHPPIHQLNKDLSPEEFELVFRANKAESVVYRIVSSNQGTDNTPVVLTRHRLTLYRKQPDGRRQVGIRIEALNPDQADWMLDAPVFGEDIIGALQNDPATLFDVVDETVAGEIRFDVEDCLGQAGKLSFGRLLHRLEAARIGRPSTYAATLKRLFEDSMVLALDRTSGAVTLTPAGVELGARLQTRCDDLTSIDFARAFDQKLNAVAAGTLAPKHFLTWVLALSRPVDPLAAVAATKLWDSVDDLSGDRISGSHGLEGKGGFISQPAVAGPDVAPLASSKYLDE
jgi:hypothetical protein